MGNGDSCLVVKSDRDVKFTIHILVVLRLKMHNAILSHPYAFMANKGSKLPVSLDLANLSGYATTNNNAWIVVTYVSAITVVSEAAVMPGHSCRSKDHHYSIHLGS
jgi:hypothetical protein